VFQYVTRRLAIQDLADARMLLNLARQRGIGVELPLISLPFRS
jgi:hypothetical protein